MQSIISLKANETAIITSLNCKGKIKLRLMELGFVKGTKIKVLAISSLNKTYLLEIMDYTLALRSSILKDVLICKN